jgi:hypothetical protein
MTNMKFDILNFGIFQDSKEYSFLLKDSMYVDGAHMVEYLDFHLFNDIMYIEISNIVVN